jgi:hypothetical protein
MNYENKPNKIFLQQLTTNTVKRTKTNPQGEHYLLVFCNKAADVQNFQKPNKRKMVWKSQETTKQFSPYMVYHRKTSPPIKSHRNSKHQTWSRI